MPGASRCAPSATITAATPRRTRWAGGRKKKPFVSGPRASATTRLPVEPSPTAGEPPRISQTRWFERKHHEVSEAKFAREAVGGRFNCVACHRDAEHGDFDEDRVKIPR